jgi:hypothetical protein
MSSITKKNRASKKKILELKIHLDLRLASKILLGE